MFKTIEIKIGDNKKIIDKCNYKLYKNVIKEIQVFIDECLDDEENLKKELVLMVL